MRLFLIALLMARLAPAPATNVAVDIPNTIGQGVPFMATITGTGPARIPMVISFTDGIYDVNSFAVTPTTATWPDGSITVPPGETVTVRYTFTARQPGPQQLVIGGQVFMLNVMAPRRIFVPLIAG